MAQACHAVAAFGTQYPKEFTKWHNGERNIVCLQAKDEAHLLSLIEELPEDALHTEFFEPDLEDHMTAFACDRVPKNWSSLPLALKAPSQSA